MRAYAFYCSRMRVRDPALASAIQGVELICDRAESGFWFYEKFDGQYSLIGNTLRGFSDVSGLCILFFKSFGVGL